MRILRCQLVLLALILVCANAWCAAQCIITPCQDPAKLPPCHRQRQAAKLCAAPAFLVQARTGAAPLPAQPLALLPAPSIGALAFQPALAPDAAPSPPAFTVLKI
jgi:hypothetical protein